MRPAASSLVLAAAFALAALEAPACTANCATFEVAVVVLDQATGELLCDATVVFLRGDAGVTLTGSSPVSDAEVAASSPLCQWDTVVGGGTYGVNASAPGFDPGSATLDLPTDRCGTAGAPVTIVLTHSGSNGP